MKSRLINVIAAIYICFAILAAHSSLVAAQATAAARTDNQTYVATSTGLVRDTQRLSESYEDSYFNVVVPVKPRATKDAYTIVLWTGDACSACAKYKKTELPALRKLGYRVVIKDYFKDKKERPKEVKMLPTIQLNYKGKPIEFKIYWKAEDIDDFIEGRSALKG